MIRSILFKNNTAITSFSLVAILLNAFLFTSPQIGFLSALMFFWGVGGLTGPVIYKGGTILQQTMLGIASTVAIISIIGSILYYVGPVYQIHYVILTVSIGILAIAFNKLLKSKTKDQTEEETPSKTIWIALSIIIIALGAWWSAVAPLEITNSIRSPWDALNITAILAMGVAVFALIFALRLGSAKKVSILLLAITFFSAIAVTSSIYPIGFGFDSFIHRATVSYIAEFGTITPKPFYYIGQYALELTAVHVFSLPLLLVDKFLVPILAAFIIATTSFIGFSSILKTKSKVALISIFLLPLGAFITTTPQSLAYIYSIALLFLSLPILLGKKSAPSKWLLAVFTAAALITHPLAGIPAAIYFGLILTSTFKGPHPAISKVLTGVTAVLGSITLPFVFVLQASQSNLEINFNPGNLFDLSKLDVSVLFANRFSTWLDGLYLFIDNFLWLLIALAILGVVLSKKNGAPNTLHLPVLAALLWLINYWILSTTLEFNFLIEYERTNYSARLLTLAAIFLIPHAGLAIHGIFSHLKDKPRSISAVFSAILSLIIVANIYSAYPRNDNYTRSSGFNVGENDLDAVWEIDSIGEDEDFVVLANQAVSAASLELFGFKKYYQNDVFYYPIPTGGELYDIFIESMDDPSLQTIEKAMDLTNTDLAFLVVNDYWWESDRVREHAKKSATEWFSLGGGSVSVFIYRR